jgi:hypothetical protein
MIRLLLEKPRHGSVLAAPACAGHATKESVMTKAKKPAAKKAHKTGTGKAAAKPTSKLGQLEAMLRRPDGATIAQLVKALEWQAHSVRGAMSGSLKKKQGLKIAGTKEEGKDRIYRIAE